MISNKYLNKVLFQSIAVFILFHSSYEFDYKNTSRNSYVQQNNKINVTQNYFKNIIKQNNVSYILNNNFNDLKDESLSAVAVKNSLNANLSDPYVLVLRELFEKRNNSQQNDTTSESRTLSSWLGLKRFRRPQHKNRPYVRLPLPRPQRTRPQMGPPVLPNFMPPPDGFPSPNDPDSYLLPPSMFEDTGIKYWLQFIENGGNNDGNNDGSTVVEHDSRAVVNRGNSRLKRPANVAASSASKPIEIGEKPSDDDDYLQENDENNSDRYESNNDKYEKNSNNDEPNSSNSQSTSSHDTHKFDTSPRCDRFTSDICVDDFEYPEQAIVDEIYKRREIFELMYSEVKDNTPLVDGIPRDVEESYSYDYYSKNNNNNNKDTESSSSEFGNSGEKPFTGGGFVCPSEVLYGKPKLARNKKGEWKVIVNAAEFTQTVRMEKCFDPNSRCNYISYPDYDSRCAQVNSFHRLLVFEKGKGFYIDTFRIPTACSCHVNRKISYNPIQSASVSDNYEKKRKPSPALSNTLWSILGGNDPNTGSSSITQQQDLIRNQISLLQQLKHFPQLSHTSPENVIKQLMDFQSNAQALAIPQQSYPQRPQNAASMTFKHPSLQGLGQNGVEYMMPTIMVNEDHSNPQQTLRNRPRPLQIHQSPGTTTYVNPNANGGPVVQVIHVPVSSGVASNPEPAPVYKAPHNPSFSDYSYLDASSLFYKKKPTSEEFYSDEMPVSENFRPLLLQMSSKTNTSLMSPSKVTDEEERDSSDSSVSISKNSDSDETAKKRKASVQSTLNKKINFSYHPILEYISN